MEEYLDLIDKNGNLTGEKELRSVIHENGLWHRTVHIYFYRNNGSEIELLVHLRSKNKSSHPNCWDTRFGGHLESGQTFENAAIREVSEETGLSINIDDLLVGKKRSSDGEKNKEITQVYYYEFNDDLDKISFDDGEVQEVKWMSINDIERAIKSESNWTSSKSGLNAIASELSEKLK
jgi:8-oxo-dGTP diphosphatase